MDFEISPLDAAFGGEVRGWDPSAPLSPRDLEVLRAALDRFVVLLFRGQPSPDDEELVRFAGSFGELKRGAELFEQDAQSPFILRVANEPEKGAGLTGATILPWHTDYSYLDRPAKESFLEAMVLPDSGGATSFCNMYRAWDALDAASRARLEGRSAWHLTEAFSAARNAEETEEQRLESEEHQRRYEFRTPAPERDAWHPVAYVHPEFSKTALYLDTFVDQIEGLAPEESRRLRDELLAAATTADNVYRHEWRVGDLVVFDQVGALHRRERFDWSQTRIMRQLSTMLPSLSERGDVARDAEHDFAG